MIIYTDGATSNNGYQDAVGGWAYVIINKTENIMAQDSGRINEATNNICELTALINACKTADIYKTNFIVYSDSAYAINCYKQKWYKKWQTNGWLNSKKEPVANKDLWEQLIPYFEKNNFTFEKVKGHADNKLDPHAYWNNYVDRLAVEAKSLI